jgi:cytochrome o ubiquinol oxidase subunit 2
MPAASCNVGRLRRILYGTSLPLLLSGCAGSVLSPVGPVGTAERTILLDSLAIMLAIVVPTIAATLVFAWWFRASNKRARRLPDWSYSGELELIVWSIPALVVLFLGGIAWISAHELDPAQPLAGDGPPLEVEVIALDWKWLFLYPQQGIASVNRLVVPTKVPLQLRITSASVFNAFFVPRVGSQIYAMNGMVSRLNLQVDSAGTYAGLSSHFSGDGFSGMSFELQAVSADEFAAWTGRTRTAGKTLDVASYKDLLRQSQNIAPYTYAALQPGLFNAVVRHELPSGEGPPAGAASPAAQQ